MINTFRNCTLNTLLSLTLQTSQCTSQVITQQTVQKTIKQKKRMCACARARGSCHRTRYSSALSSAPPFFPHSTSF